MANKASLETFKYFIECYFHADINYSDFEKVIFEFKRNELKKHSENLLNEAKMILKVNDWSYMHEFIYKHAYRSYEKDILVEMVWTIIKVLSE